MTLTSIQEEIIREVCKIQKASFDRITSKLFDEKAGDNLFLILLDQHGVPLEKYVNELTSSKRKFEEVIEVPQKVFELKALDISLFRHILFNFMDKYKKSYPVALKVLWQRLFIKEDQDTLTDKIKGDLDKLINKN